MSRCRRGTAGPSPGTYVLVSALPSPASVTLGWLRGRTPPAQDPTSAAMCVFRPRQPDPFPPLQAPLPTRPLGPHVSQGLLPLETAPVSTHSHLNNSKYEGGSQNVPVSG